jgi:CMP-N-acetylneuraminic acid synthetase
MKIVAFVPIKLENERLPGKNLMAFGDGTPLIHLIQRTLLELKNNMKINEIYVYCSSDAISPYLLEGVKFLKRPTSLDDAFTLGREIYTAFADLIDADIYILAHATSPFVSSSTILHCLNKVKTGFFDSSFAAKKLQNFIWVDNKPFNFDLTNPPRTQDLDPIYLEISSPYIFSKSVIQNYNSRTGCKPFIHTCSEIEAIDIDTMEDFTLANYVYMSIINL